MAGAVTLGLLALLGWSVPVEPTDDVWIWLLRIGLSLGAVAAAFSVFKHPVEPKFQELLAGVKPFAGWTCPLCGGQLLSIPNWHCTACGG